MALETEDLSDSGMEKQIDRIDIAAPNSPRVPPEGAEMDLQIDQLRPHNQQQYSRDESGNHNKQLSINLQPENKCQASQSATNSTANVSFIDINIEEAARSSSNKCGADSSSQSINQHNPMTIPFSNTMYAAFKKGNVVRGILCPSLTNSFR